MSANSPPAVSKKTKPSFLVKLPNHAVQPSGDGIVSEVSDVISSIDAGFGNLPNQIHRKAVNRGFTFNMMITGFPGVGKASFVNAFFCSDIYNAEYEGPSKRTSEGTRIDCKTFMLRESHISLKLRIIDTPGYGHLLDNSNCWKPLLDYIQMQFEIYLHSEMHISRQVVGSGNGYTPTLTEDNRIHACLYFVAPNGHGLHPVDIQTLKALNSKVNLILVIGRSDSLTTGECNQLKAKITAQLNDSGIVLYDFPESVAFLGGAANEKTQKEIREWRNRLPFAVVCSDQIIKQADGKKVLGRMYPWGLVETENLEHNDFFALKNLLTSLYLHDLIYTTHTQHYANYHSLRLAEISAASQFPVPVDGKVPLTQLELERLNHDKLMSNVEAQHELAFRQKVQEFVDNLAKSKQEYERRAAQLKEQVAAVNAELSQTRQVFENEVAAWEQENRSILEMIEKAGVKDKQKKKGLF